MVWSKFLGCLLLVFANVYSVISKEFDARIVGGQDADPLEYPYFVQWKGCGASLIWEDILLTAAHCKEQLSNYVLIGAYRQDSVQGDPINSELRTIIQRSPHPDYTLDYSNDVMLLKIDQSVDHPTIAVNDDDSRPSTEHNLTVVGFGTQDPRRRMTDSTTLSYGDVLQEVEIEYIPQEVCNSDEVYMGYIKDDIMLCAGDLAGGKDSCFGDSGGPLVQYLEDGSVVQVGIVSFGAGCARENNPGVYTRLSTFYEWIQEQICDMSSNPPESCVKETVQPTSSPTSNPTQSPTQSPTASLTVEPTQETAGPRLTEETLPPLQVGHGIFQGHGFQSVAESLGFGKRPKNST
eukprot:Nitzschia sp. Nitz4//scaffold25_size161228//85672//86970//NITZ4_002434-RA/size161228-augustus-gene-0.114-mRNA-1//1//CDS//3329544598//990//frame0